MSYPSDDDIGYGYVHRTEKPWKKPIRVWEVIDSEGGRHEIHVHYSFNNGAEGLVFRTYPKGEQKTEITAAFSQIGWKFYKEITRDQI